MTKRESLIFMIKNIKRDRYVACSAIECCDCVFDNGSNCGYNVGIDLESLYIELYGEDSLTEELL